jgi:hypothetical protein
MRYVELVIFRFPEAIWMNYTCVTGRHYHFNSVVKIGTGFPYINQPGRLCQHVRSIFAQIWSLFGFLYKKTHIFKRTFFWPTAKHMSHSKYPCENSWYFVDPTTWFRMDTRNASEPSSISWDSRKFHCTHLDQTLDQWLWNFESAILAILQLSLGWTWTKWPLLNNWLYPSIDFQSKHISKPHWSDPLNHFNHDSTIIKKPSRNHNLTIIQPSFWFCLFLLVDVLPSPKTTSTHLLISGGDAKAKAKAEAESGAAPWCREWWMFLWENAGYFHVFPMEGDKHLARILGIKKRPVPHHISVGHLRSDGCAVCGVCGHQLEGPTSVPNRLRTWRSKPC